MDRRNVATIGEGRLWRQEGIHGLEARDWTQSPDEFRNYKRLQWEKKVPAFAVEISPYNAFMRNENISGSLAEAGKRLKDVHSRSSGCVVRVFTLCSDDPGNDFSIPIAGSCEFNYEEQMYSVEQLLELKRRVWDHETRFKSRVVLLQGILPPVMEVLGGAMSIPPSVFQQHVQDAWGSESDSKTQVTDPIPHNPRSYESFNITFPNLLIISSPHIISRSDLREKYFKMAAKHLQCQRVLPLLDIVSENMVEAVTFEHVTCFTEYFVQQRAGSVDTTEGDRQGSWTS